MKDSRFYQNLLLSSGKVSEALRSLSKLFGGLISIQDATRELKAKGFNNPEEVIRKLMSEGKIRT
ncbi:MAG: hypothetical protein QXW12_03805 [Nitrososphaerota archaeon]